MPGDACFTGDGRGDAPEHYHGPWCSGDDNVCKANCVEAALQMIRPLPEMCSRRSFHGHLRCVDHTITLEAVGMLREAFSGAKAHAPISRRGGASQPISHFCLGDLLARPRTGPEQSVDENEQSFIDCEFCWSCLTSCSVCCDTGSACRSARTRGAP